MVIYFLNQKQKGVPFLNRPVIHKLFLVACVGWGVYMLLDIFIYSCAGLSFSFIDPFPIAGYPKNYPSLLIANILRDIALLGGCIHVWCYLIIPYSIKYGEHATRKLLKKWYFILITLIAWTIFIFFDVIVIDKQGYDIVVTEKWSAFGGINFILITTFYFIGAFRLRIVLKKLIIKEKVSTNYKKKMKLLIFGIFIMGCGHIVSIIRNFIVLIFSLSQNLEFWIFLVGSYLQFYCWLLSPIYIFKSLNVEIEETNIQSLY